jgi:hypothetical protein
MAYLLDITAQTCFPLVPHHTFGRLAASVDTHVDKPYVSKLHAAVEWNGRGWHVKNLGLNGTWVNDQTLGQGESVELKVNDMIHLAERADAGFQVLDLTPPADMLWPVNCADLNSTQPVYLARYHLLPDNQTPEIALFFNEQYQAWYAEAINGLQDEPGQLVSHGSSIHFSGLEWQFVRAQVYGPTEARVSQPLRLADIEFVFHLSLDEETTQLELHHPQQTIDLAVRTHHYLLLQLARHRAEDSARGLDNNSQGWTYADQLAAELGLDSTHMNIQIFRARKQLADCLPNNSGHQDLLERSGGKIRFGGEKFKIFKGGTLVASADNA